MNSVDPMTCLSPTHRTCADSFKVGMIFACVVMLVLLIALTVTGWILIHKDGSAKEGIPRQSDSDSARKDVNSD